MVTVHSPEEGPQGFIFPLFFLGVLMAQAPNFLSSLVIHPFAATLGHILWEQGIGKGGCSVRRGSRLLNLVTLGYSR